MLSFYLPSREFKTCWLMGVSDTTSNFASNVAIECAARNAISMNVKLNTFKKLLINITLILMASTAKSGRAIAHRAHPVPPALL